MTHKVILKTKKSSFYDITAEKRFLQKVTVTELFIHEWKLNISLIFGTVIFWIP